MTDYPVMMSAAQKQALGWFDSTISSLENAMRDMRRRRQEFMQCFGSSDDMPERVLGWALNDYRNLMMAVRLDTPVGIGADLGAMRMHLLALRKEAADAAARAKVTVARQRRSKSKSKKK